MKKLEKFVVGAVKLVEVIEWVCAICAVVLLVLSLFINQAMIESIFTAESSHALDLGFFKVAFDNAEVHAWGISRLHFIIVGISAALYALIFRSIHKMFRSVFKDGNTPFSDENVKHIKNIGMYIICMPIIGLVLSIIGQIIFRDINSSITIEAGSILMGLIIICLSRVFSYGVSLQKDSDGLI